MKARSMLLTAGFAGLLVVAGVAGAEETAPDAAPVPEGPVTTVSEGDPTDDLLIRRERYFYSSFARRDPFKSLISGAGMGTMAGDLLDIGELDLVGVVWGDNDKFAVVEDQRGHVHVLHEGDRVVNGKVVKITDSNLTVTHYFFGESANVTIQLKQGEGE